MKILDLLLKDGGGLFMARNPEGNPVLLCRTSFMFEAEREKLILDNPDILNWDVIQEHVEHEG